MVAAEWPRRLAAAAAATAAARERRRNEQLRAAHGALCARRGARSHTDRGDGPRARERRLALRDALALRSRSALEQRGLLGELRRLYARYMTNRSACDRAIIILYYLPFDDRSSLCGPTLSSTALGRDKRAPHKDTRANQR